MQIQKRWNEGLALAIGVSFFLVLVVVPAARAQNPPIY
jgi:hypothetical protein